MGNIFLRIVYLLWYMSIMFINESLGFPPPPNEKRAGVPLIYNFILIKPTYNNGTEILTSISTQPNFRYCLKPGSIFPLLQVLIHIQAKT